MTSSSGPQILSASGRRRFSQVSGLIRPSFSRYRNRLLLGFAALVGVDFLQLIIPRLLKIAVDGLAAGRATERTLLLIGFFILLTAVIAAFLRFCWRYLIVGFSRLLERDIRNRIYAHVLTMDRPFLEKHTTGDIMAHVSNDLQAVQMACGIGLVSAFDALVMSTAAICFMLYIDVELTLLALLPMPLLAVSTRILTSRLHHRFNLVQEQFGLLTEFVRSALVSIRLIKAYTMERLQKRDFENLGWKFVRSNIQVAYVQGLLFPLATLVGHLGMLMVLYFGGRFAIEGKISLGDFVAFVTYLSMLVWPMMAIGWVASLAQRGLTSLNRIQTLLSTVPLLRDAPDRGGNAAPGEPSFHLRNLTFTYPNGTHPVLRNISLELHQGVHGITGRTGSGKSTLCKLLARLYPVADGTLFFGGRDVNTLPLRTVRDCIGYVGQEAFLFSATVRENIAFARPEAEFGEIVAAARAAAIHDDIVSFPLGYETVVGERGVTLSGGQRQRVALARALLSDRPVLIIDDALSALDVETEDEVLRSITGAGRGRLVLLVSQRIKLLSGTDGVIILEKGEIVDRGVHTELLDRNDFYQIMYAKQSRENAGKEEVAAPAMTAGGMRGGEEDA
ncbi:MAG: ABC transporter ATP-binding protein [Desulfobulbaceae bacterium]|nr:ABC transporter ATP-binding protein [Desulfobulbaceae bacterium]